MQGKTLMHNLLASVKSLRLPVRIICWYIGNGRFWIRLFGRGVSIRNIQRFPLKFSERYEYKKYWKLGKWIFTYVPFAKLGKRYNVKIPLDKESLGEGGE